MGEEVNYDHQYQVVVQGDTYRIIRYGGRADGSDITPAEKKRLKRLFPTYGEDDDKPEPPDPPDRP